jgi:hypothetical protein
MNRRYGYGTYALVGALTVVVMIAGFQLGPLSSPLGMVAGAVVGALFGAAVRDARR